MAQTRKRLPIVGIARIPAAIAADNPSLAIHEKHHESKVIVEFEMVEVGPLNPGQPHLHKLARLLGDLFQTDNLPVKFMAIRSGYASKNQHHRLA
jgi:hypothetical protein